MAANCKQAFGAGTGLPLTLRPMNFWDLAHRGQPHEDAFCALIAQTNPGCVACLEAEEHANVFSGLMRIIVKVAPIGAFGAMAFTAGSQGLPGVVPRHELAFVMQVPPLQRVLYSLPEHSTHSALLRKIRMSQG
jgi:hypothetical protein